MYFWFSHICAHQLDVQEANFSLTRLGHSGSLSTVNETCNENFENVAILNSLLTSAA